MAKIRRIPTPISQHWNYFRTSVLPLIAFVICVWATLILWQRRALDGTMTAEAEHISIDVASAADGTLVPLEREWQLWDEVGKGDVIARLDDSLLAAQIDVVKGQTDRIVANLESTKARTEVDVVSLKQTYKRDVFNRVFQEADFAVQEKQIEVALARNRFEARRLKEQLNILERAGDAAVLRDRVNLQKQIEAIAAEYNKNKYLLEEVRKQLAKARREVEQFTQQMLEIPELSDLRENIRRAVEAQEAEIEMINLKIENMTIRAPVAGVISAILKRPGEAVVQGEPVVRIDSDTAHYVIGYWREQHRVRPQPGKTKVRIRLPQPEGKEYECTIAEVGPQIAPVPQHQLKDFDRPEYGLPVKIQIPDELINVVKPGELVHVIYRDSDNRPSK